MTNSIQGSHFLITGATGFLGSRVIHELARLGGKITILHRKTSNFSRIERYRNTIDCISLENFDFNCLASLNVDFVLHLATSYARPDKHNIRETIEANLIFPLLILEALNRREEPLVFINTDTSLPRGVNFYSLSKHQFVEWATVFAGRIKIINMQLSHFYGPGDNEQKFVSWLLKNLINNVDYLNLTQGDQHRDFVFIDDVVAAIITVLRSVRGGKIIENFLPFYVGRGSTISLHQFCLLAREITGSSTELRFGALKYRPNEIMMPEHDISFIESLGWTPRVGLEQGLKLTISSFNKN